MALRWKCGVLTTGPLGNALCSSFDAESVYESLWGKKGQTGIYDSTMAALKFF